MLAGGQSLIPAMRFRLARPAILVDINSVNDLSYLRVDGQSLAIGAIARDVDIERAPWIADRRWSLLHDACRVIADPVVRQMGTVVGSLCHNDPAGDWTTVALAARAQVVVRGKGGKPEDDDRRLPRRQLHDGHGRRRDGAGCGVSRARTTAPPARTRKSSARSATSPPTAAAAVQVSLNTDGTIRATGVALSAAGSDGRPRGRSGAFADGSEADRRSDSGGFRCRVALQRAAGRPARRRRLQEASGRHPRRARLA